MDMMNEAMKRRKNQGFEVKIHVEPAGAHEAQEADQGSDLAPNAAPNAHADAAAQMPGVLPELDAEPIRTNSLHGKAMANMAKMKKGK
jgi:hypothetical protein